MYIAHILLKCSIPGRLPHLDIAGWMEWLGREELLVLVANVVTERVANKKHSGMDNKRRGVS